MTWEDVLKIISVALSVLLGLGALAASIGYLIGKARGGKDDGIEKAFAIKDHQIETYQLEIRNLNEKFDREVSALNARLDDSKGIEKHLMSQVEALTAENTSLRKLVMLQDIPQPLKEFVQGVAGENKNLLLEIKDMVERLSGKPDSGRRVTDPT